MPTPSLGAPEITSLENEIKRIRQEAQEALEKRAEEVGADFSKSLNKLVDGEMRKFQKTLRDELAKTLAEAAIRSLGLEGGGNLRLSLGQQLAQTLISQVKGQRNT